MSPHLDLYFYLRYVEVVSVDNDLTCLLLLAFLILKTSTYAWDFYGGLRERPEI